jgi:hypothetical protein
MTPTKQLTKLVVHVKLVCTDWPPSAVKIHALFWECSHDGERLLYIYFNTSKLARATHVYTIARQQILKKLSRDRHVDKLESISRFLLASIPGDTPPQPIC